MAGVRTSHVLVGLLCGVAANLIWGLAFLVPVLLPPSDSVEITLGRYLFYGVVSVGIAAFTGMAGLRGHNRRVWQTGMVFAFAGNLGYYFFLVQGVAHVGAPVTTVIIGTLPVTVALAGNWVRHESSFSRLLLPLGLIAVGLVLVNMTEVDWRTALGSRSVPAQVIGIGSALTALALWTWYGVANATFLKGHPEISSSAWSTLIGVNTLVLTLVALPVAGVAGGLRFGGVGALLSVLAGSLVLGVLVSWIGSLLWNRASGELPISVAGQLIVVETISGLTYVFVATARVPPPLEVAGVALLLSGVLLGIRRTRQAAPAPEQMATAVSDAAR
jgi:drug/metabolite transporter (DMT)-like permease